MRFLFSVFISLALHLALLAGIRFDFSQAPPPLETNREIVITCSRVDLKKTKPPVKKSVRPTPGPGKTDEKKPGKAASAKKRTSKKRTGEKRTEKRMPPPKSVKPDFDIKKTNAPKKSAPDMEPSLQKEEAEIKKEIDVKKETEIKKEIGGKEQTGVKEEKRRDERRVSEKKSSRAPEARPGRRLPEYKRTSPPIYPRLAKKRGFQGVVILEILVNRRGSVEKINISESSGHRLLDDAAVTAAKKWRFTPGFDGTQSIKMWIKAPVHFKLTD